MLLPTVGYSVACVTLLIVLVLFMTTSPVMWVACKRAAASGVVSARETTRRRVVLQLRGGDQVRDPRSSPAGGFSRLLEFAITSTRRFSPKVGSAGARATTRTSELAIADARIGGLRLRRG
jgi:hypothetical protein